MDKFNIWRKTNSVWVLRNRVKELEIHTKQPELIEKYLRDTLPNDYQEYLKTYDIPYSVHAYEWWCNHLSKYAPEQDEDDVRFMFTRSIPASMKVS